MATGQSNEGVGSMGFVKSAINKSKRGNLTKKVVKAPTPVNSKANPAMQAAIARRLGAANKAKPFGSGPGGNGVE